MKGLTILILCLPLVLQAQNNFPYKLKRTDFYLMPSAIALTAGGGILSNKKDHNLTLAQIQSLNRNSVNRFDRIATKQWSLSAAQFSNYPNRIIPALAAAVVIPQLKNKQWKNAATLGIMYTEVLLFTRGFTEIIKSTAGRTRPYLYNDAYTTQQRFDWQGKEGPVASTSFISGHSSKTFAFAVFLSKTYTDIYGRNIWSRIIWGTSLSIATATAYARVKAGVHFPTDVIAGAVVGSAIGYFIPVLHKIKPERLSVTATPNQFLLVYNLP